MFLTGLFQVWIHSDSNRTCSGSRSSGSADVRWWWILQVTRGRTDEWILDNFYIIVFLNSRWSCVYWLLSAHILCRWFVAGYNSTKLKSVLVHRLSYVVGLLLSSSRRHSRGRLDDWWVFISLVSSVSAERKKQWLIVSKRKSCFAFRLGIIIYLHFDLWPFTPLLPVAPPTHQEPQEAGPGSFKAPQIQHHIINCVIKHSYEPWSSCLMSHRSLTRWFHTMIRFLQSSTGWFHAGWQSNTINSDIKSITRWNFA